MTRRKLAPPTGTGVTLVTPDLLTRLLDLPTGHRVTGVEWDFARQLIRVYVQGKDIPVVERGHLLPLLTPEGTMSKGVSKETSEDVYQFNFDWTATMANPAMAGVTQAGG